MSIQSKPLDDYQWTTNNNDQWTTDNTKQWLPHYVDTVVTFITRSNTFMFKTIKQTFSFVTKTQSYMFKTIKNIFKFITRS